MVDNVEYNIAQESGWCIDLANRGGDYYPRIQRLKDEEAAAKIMAEDLPDGDDAPDVSASLDEDIPW